MLHRTLRNVLALLVCLGKRENRILLAALLSAQLNAQAQAPDWRDLNAALVPAMDRGVLLAQSAPHQAVFLGQSQHLQGFEFGLRQQSFLQTGDSAAALNVRYFNNQINDWTQTFATLDMTLFYRSGEFKPGSLATRSGVDATQLAEGFFRIGKSDLQEMPSGAVVQHLACGTQCQLCGFARATRGGVWLLTKNEITSEPARSHFALSRVLTNGSEVESFSLGQFAADGYCGIRRDRTELLRISLQKSFSTQPSDTWLLGVDDQNNARLQGVSNAQIGLNGGDGLALDVADGQTQVSRIAPGQLVNGIWNPLPSNRYRVSLPGVDYRVLASSPTQLVVSDRIHGSYWLDARGQVLLQSSLWRFADFTPRGELAVLRRSDSSEQTGLQLDWYQPDVSEFHQQAIAPVRLGADRNRTSLRAGPDNSVVSLSVYDSIGKDKIARIHSDSGDIVLPALPPNIGAISGARYGRLYLASLSSSQVFIRRLSDDSQSRCELAVSGQLDDWSNGFYTISNNQIAVFDSACNPREQFEINGLREVVQTSDAAGGVRLFARPINSALPNEIAVLDLIETGRVQQRFRTSELISVNEDGSVIYANADGRLLRWFNGDASLLPSACLRTDKFDSANGCWRLRGAHIMHLDAVGESAQAFLGEGFSTILTNARPGNRMLGLYQNRYALFERVDNQIFFALQDSPNERCDASHVQLQGNALWCLSQRIVAGVRERILLRQRFDTWQALPDFLSGFE
jgi:hypothetical protein